MNDKFQVVVHDCAPEHFKTVILGGLTTTGEADDADPIPVDAWVFGNYFERRQCVYALSCSPH